MTNSDAGSRRAPLGDLLDRLSDEPSIDAALGRREPFIVIGDAGRALVLAGLVAASDLFELFTLHGAPIEKLPWGVVLYLSMTE